MNLCTMSAPLGRANGTALGIALAKSSTDTTLRVQRDFEAFNHFYFRVGVMHMPDL